MITFLVTAVWHGFYPGYFIFFFVGGMCDYIYKEGEKRELFPWMPRIVKLVLI